MDSRHSYKNQIRVILAEKEKTNHWLAEQIGVTDMTVSRWTTNKIQPSMSQFIDISKVLNVSLEDLMEDKL
jgi:DNA-binding XRE family transcriptional regulator